MEYLENNVSHCIICLESHFENNLLKQINCGCRANIHKECLEKYLESINLEQKCPICSNTFSPKYEILSKNDNIVLNKFKNKLDSIFCKNYFLIFIYSILHIIYLILSLLFIVIIFYYGVITFGYIVKLFLLVFTREFDSNYDNIEHFELGTFGLFISGLVLIINKKSDIKENDTSIQIINF